MNKPLKTLFLILLSLQGLLPSCKKEETQSVKVTTDPVSLISRTSGVVKGSFINEGPDTIIAYGFCWSSDAQPTYDDNRIVPQSLESGNSTNGTYISGINGLSPGTTYYVRVYAVTVESKIYGNEETFTTKPPTALTTFNPDLTYQSVSDIDGNIYKTINIDTHEWMAENLKTTRYNDGTVIPLVTDDTQWNLLNTPGYCWYNNDEAVFKNIYGGYYNWYAVNTGKLCPAGWHVPDETDWAAFKEYLGMTPDEISGLPFKEVTEGNKIKETGTFNWVEGSVTATNESGFTALPGGMRRVGPVNFGGEGTTATWWSSETRAPVSHWVYSFEEWFFRSDMLQRGYGFNVRCVKDL
jgi:uncharacterized protein (TIGR02145 family)